MYNSEFVAERIKLIAKQQGKSIKDMLITCNLNKNVLSTMTARGSMPKADTLAKIADYLGCSVDYLMGRNNDISASMLYNAYKSHPEHQAAINTLLGIKGLSTVPAEDNYKIAAFGGNSEEAEEPEEIKTT